MQVEMYCSECSGNICISWSAVKLSMRLLIYQKLLVYFHNVFIVRKTKKKRNKFFMQVDKVKCEIKVTGNQLGETVDISVNCAFG